MPGASPSSANHRQPSMMEVQVEGTTLREEDYDLADWTKIIGTYQGKSQSKARMEDTNGVRGKQKASEERTETLPASTWRLTYRPNPAHLRATQQVKRKSRQMAPLPQYAKKVVFRSQGGLFLPNIQPQRLLRCLCETAKILMGEEVQLRVHPMNNTCTVATTNQEAALNLVKIGSITLNAKACWVAAYIVPAAGTVRGMISNAFWDETEEELLQDLQARNPEAGILLARRMGNFKSILITFAQGPIPHRIIYYGGVHLCTPYRARPEACTNCRAPGHRYDVCPEPKIPRCPRCGEDRGEDRTRQCVPRCILCGGEHLTGTGRCKATKRQQTTKPPVNRETTGRRQLHPEDFPRWNPSAPPPPPEGPRGAHMGRTNRPQTRPPGRGDDPSSRGVAAVEIRGGTNDSNLISDFESHEVMRNVVKGNLDPLPAGAKHDVTIAIPRYWATTDDGDSDFKLKAYLAARVINAEGIKSDLSGTVSAEFNLLDSTAKSDTTTPAPTTAPSPGAKPEPGRNAPTAATAEPGSEPAAEDTREGDDPSKTGEQSLVMWTLLALAAVLVIMTIIICLLMRMKPKSTAEDECTLMKTATTTSLYTEGFPWAK
ncbi:hypothetical protein HPB49_018831 [Dermacentor silvarum]|uniref:Uncharacterized protein n=1 Tax=Dermacentor silvarum TaxID=543639 RepID=A0ACB8DQT8_DERSI|nr:hypothetical protein HPB49_018831 [Dermacentor silvarum]